MSLPQFPTISPPLDRQDAINQIISSIAMEELALSHIINAEGEKLQYILGTLPGQSGPSPTIDEVLEVNDSVREVLQSAAEFQTVLRAKLQSALSQATMSGPSGPDGLSAYEIAVKYGFTGTEQDWLASVGSTGPQGATGADGKTPNITVGTVTQVPYGDTPFIVQTGTNLDVILNFGLPAGKTGEDGATGATGATGANGLNGATGATGATGIQGITGPTGWYGTPGEKGEKGATGATGATGSQGPQGDKGDPGEPCTDGNSLLIPYSTRDSTFISCDENGEPINALIISFGVLALSNEFNNGTIITSSSNVSLSFPAATDFVVTDIAATFTVNGDFEYRDDDNIKIIARPYISDPINAHRFLPIPDVFVEIPVPNSVAHGTVLMAHIGNLLGNVKAGEQMLVAFTLTNSGVFNNQYIDGYAAASLLCTIENK